MTCPICKDARHQTIWTKGRFSQRLTNVVCLNCGLVFVDPPVSLPADFYHEDYRRQYVGQAVLSPDIAVRRQRDAERRWRYLADRLPHLLPSRGLEIGCSSGHFLRVLTDHGWQSFGIDPDRSYTEYGRSHLGLTNLTTGLFMGAEFENEQFGLVAMFHTLEHIPDPVLLLNHVHRRLVNGGILFLEVPDVERPYFGDFDFFFQAAHPFSFSPSSLGNLLLMTGFELIRIDHHQNFMLALARKVSAGQAPVADPKIARDLLRRLKWWRIGYWVLFRWAKAIKRLGARNRL